MSTRQLLNLALGAVALMLIASVTLVWNQGHSSASSEQQIDLAQEQQVVIQDLGRQVVSLQQAEQRDAVAAARRQVGRAVLAFDRNLTVLAQGGVLTAEDGGEIAVAKVRGGKARQALDDAVQTWRLTGAPLADLAAGEYSVYSAAGQEAVQGLEDNTVVLMEQMGAIANALSAGVVARQALAGFARWATGIFGLMLVVLAWFRIKVTRFERSEDSGAGTSEQDSREQASHIAEALTPPDQQEEAPSRSLTPPAAATRRPRELRPQSGPAAAGPVDFESINATVDQLTVDMNTIATSTDKMRLAIDSVGGALQGMLDSLDEMAQDADEGHKIVRGANNAASFTAEAASDLVDTAREMTGVVERVTRLALKTRHVASQIDADAVATGQTGAAFTSVVAAEVKGLAAKTSRSTLEIENTVSEIMAVSRQYEESIGHIIKNIGAINRVSRHLGELMLAPPAQVVPGQEPQAALTPPAAEPQPVPAPDPVEPEETPLPEPPTEAPDPFVQADAEPAEVETPVPEISASEPEPEPEPDPSPSAFSLDDDDDDPAPPDLEAVTEETRKVIEELGLDDPEPAAEPERSTTDEVEQAVENLLSTPENEQPAAPQAEAVPEAEDQAAEDAAQPPVEEDAPPAAPPAEEPVVDAAPEPEPAPEPAMPERENVKSPLGSNGNVFMLNKPRKAPETAENPPEAADPQDPEVARTADETVPADGGPDEDRPSVFRLEKPQKTD